MLFPKKWKPRIFQQKLPKLIRVYLWPTRRKIISQCCNESDSDNAWWDSFVVCVITKLLTSEQSGQGHTNSTLQSSPAESPGNKRPTPSCLASYAPSNLDRAKVDELRQVLHVDQSSSGWMLWSQAQSTKRNLRFCNCFSIHSSGMRRRGRMLWILQNRFRSSANNSLTNTLENVVHRMTVSIFLQILSMQSPEPHPPCPTARISSNDPYSISSLARHFLWAKAIF